MQRNCDYNAGFIALPDLPEEVFVAGAIIVTLTQDGTYGTHFIAESIDELPSPSDQLDLGIAVTGAWQRAALAAEAES